VNEKLKKKKKKLTKGERIRLAFLIMVTQEGAKEKRGERKKRKKKEKKKRKKSGFLA
jgi:hypothetical protein